MSVVGLTPDGARAVRDTAGRRWPVIDGIPFLRTGSETLADDALTLLDRGDVAGATALLLADQDDWWRGPRAEPDALRHLVEQRDRLSLREAMALLRWGPVADYFAHRWSDPTYLAGLVLVAAHGAAPSGGRAFELACGIGHHLRALGAAGMDVTGADVVFAKLWVARHWVAPEATLLCVDAAADWPLRAGAFDLVCCHDAFYFLEPKPAILARLRGLRAPGGALAISHVHNADWPNLSAGSAMTAASLAAMFPDATIYDDAELTRALVEARAPRPAPAGALGAAEAFSLIEGAGTTAPRAPSGPLVLPPRGAALVRNPLYAADGALAWPSKRYAGEYGPRATYPARSDAPERAVLDTGTAARALTRELVALPERW